MTWRWNNSETTEKHTVHGKQQWWVVYVLSVLSQTWQASSVGVQTAWYVLGVFVYTSISTSRVVKFVKRPWTMLNPGDDGSWHCGCVDSHEGHLGCCAGEKEARMCMVQILHFCAVDASQVWALELCRKNILHIGHILALLYFCLLWTSLVLLK